MNQLSLARKKNISYIYYFPENTMSYYIYFIHMVTKFYNYNALLLTHKKHNMVNQMRFFLISFIIAYYLTVFCHQFAGNLPCQRPRRRQSLHHRTNKCLFLRSLISHLISNCRSWLSDSSRKQGEYKDRGLLIDRQLDRYIHRQLDRLKQENT